MGRGLNSTRPFICPLRTRFSFHQVFHDVLLVAVDPTREGHEQHLQGVDISRHGPIVPCLAPVRVYRVLGHHELGRIFG
jgi:hypothetical protein